MSGFLKEYMREVLCNEENSFNKVPKLLIGLLIKKVKHYSYTMLKILKNANLCSTELNYNSDVLTYLLNCGKIYIT